MIETLARNSAVLVTRGVTSFLFGILALTSADISVGALVKLSVRSRFSREPSPRQPELSPRAAHRDLSA
jgi:hypothetical protein